MIKLQETVANTYRVEHVKIVQGIFECSHSRATVIYEGIMEQDKFIKKAIKKPGALRRHFNTKPGETIPASDLNALIDKLTKKSAGDKTLTKPELTLLRRANLAKTLKGF